jgi:hypothetical protein
VPRPAAILARFPSRLALLLLALAVRLQSRLATVTSARVVRFRSSVVLLPMPLQAAVLLAS